jgi:hypothetical protein
VSGIEQAGVPSAAFCFGRDPLCWEIVKAAIDSGAVLLFGSRQAGKSSVLLRVRELLKHATPRDTGIAILPVYLNMQTIPPEATPSDVFRLMANEAAVFCQVDRNSELVGVGTTVDLDRLVQMLARILRRIERSDAKFLFLVDETKRILGNRFAPGFRDNLFALIYGDHELSGRCCFVFAGAQDLYLFSEDDTSPIGSRAAVKLVRNLDAEAIVRIVEACGKVGTEQVAAVAKRIMELTGGQAGLSLRLALSPTDIIGDDTAVIEQLRLKHSSVLRGWALRLSDEARSIQELLLLAGRLASAEIPARLEKQGYSRYKGDQVIEELEFTGIVMRSKDQLELVSRIYAGFMRAHLANEPGNREEHNTWSLIEAAELGLRRLVRKKYSERWTADADTRIRAVLGADSWSTIMQNKQKAAKSYRYTSHSPDGDVLHYAYFGQLVQLMVANQAWVMFRDLFRDKRELEDIAADVTPVRNSNAHFRTVPERELLRCRLRCEDLLQLLRQAGIL